MASALTRPVAVGALALLAALTLLRLAVAAWAPLVPDEAYYWVWSKALALGYFDHPPMVALWIRAGTWIAGDTPLGVRLLGPLSTALGSVLLAQAADILLPRRRDAGLWAAALLNATLMVGAGAALMTPDTPLLFFWTACLWALARLLQSGRGAWWLAAGMFAGFALDSKYTAALLGLGIVLWLLIADPVRPWLLRFWPWAGGLLALLLFLPVVHWNAIHGWASFLKQGARAGAWDHSDAARFLGELAGSQVGLATPLILVLFVAGTAEAVRHAWRTRDGGSTLLAALTLPGAVLFLQHAFGDRVQGNWPAILYPSAAIAAAGLAGPIWLKLRAPAVGLGFAITFVVYIQAAAAILPLPRKLDPTLRAMGGWADLASAVNARRREIGADFIVADDYGTASELAMAVPVGVPVIALDARWALFRLPHPDLAGRTGLLVRSARRADPVDGGYWADVAETGQVQRARSGVTAEEFRLYHVVGSGRIEGAAILPRP